MMDINLGQTLLVAPEVPFSRIAEVLVALGWRLEQQTVHQPLLAGEPEFATWSWVGHKPFVVYSFNPVARLRVLDVATVPPGLRGAIAARLPLLGDGQVNDLLFAPEPRDRLLGLWAAQETERLDLIPQTTRLGHDPVPTVAEQGRAVGQRLQRVREAREALLINLRLLAEAAEPLIRRLDDPRYTAALQPTAAELEELFDAALGRALAPALAELYRQPPLAQPGDRYPSLAVTAANAGLLRWPNELSEKFPRGYRNIAGWMNPRYIWCAWRWHDDAGNGVRYDGLVWVERRWLWLPKVYRLAAPLLDGPAPGVAVH